MNLEVSYQSYWIGACHLSSVYLDVSFKGPTSKYNWSTWGWYSICTCEENTIQPMKDPKRALSLPLQSFGASGKLCQVFKAPAS